jgi:hypothetical protein
MRKLKGNYPIMIRLEADSIVDNEKVTVRYQTWLSE